jgi:hypothetical protein
MAAGAPSRPAPQRGSGAAQLLAIGERTLWAKLKKYGI